jgi:phenylacetate-CoA ligase
LRRMTKVLGRVDDMLVIRGVNVYPTEIESVLLSDARVSPHYLIVEDRRVESRPELRIAVETVAGDGDVVRRELEHALRERLAVGCVVRVMPTGSVPRTETGKAKRLARWNEGEPPIVGLV